MTIFPVDRPAHPGIKSGAGSGKPLRILQRHQREYLHDSNRDAHFRNELQTTFEVWSQNSRWLIEGSSYHLPSPLCVFMGLKVPPLENAERWTMVIQTIRQFPWPFFLVLALQVVGIIDWIWPEICMMEISPISRTRTEQVTASPKPITFCSKHGAIWGFLKKGGSPEPRTIGFNTKMV